MALADAGVILLDGATKRFPRPTPHPHTPRTTPLHHSGALLLLCTFVAVTTFLCGFGVLGTAIAFTLPGHWCLLYRAAALACGTAPGFSCRTGFWHRAGMTRDDDSARRRQRRMPRVAVSTGQPRRTSTLRWFATPLLAPTPPSRRSRRTRARTARIGATRAARQTLLGLGFRLPPRAF